jgi:putative salt-induced outer membrane protein YdiY
MKKTLFSLSTLGYLSALCGLLALSSLLTVKAEESLSNEIKLGWSTSAELGAITTSGNTKGTSITGKVDSKQELKEWSNDYTFSAFFKRDETVADDGQTLVETSAEKYAASAKGGYRLDKDSARLFVYGSHVDDRFGAYTEYTTVAVGYGDELFKTETMSLEGEIGPGYSRGKTDLEATENGMLVRGAGTYRWQISESARFKQTVSLEYGEDNKRTIAESSLTAKINGRMQMKAAFLVQHDSHVPFGKKKTDTQTSLTFVYSF